MSKGKTIGLSIVGVIFGLILISMGYSFMTYNQQPSQGLRDSCAILKHDLQTSRDAYDQQGFMLQTRSYDDQCAGVTGAFYGK